MNTFAAWRTLTRDQRNAFLAAFLGWALDAFDFFILVFVVKDVAKEFHVEKSAVVVAITLTLAFRPVGALIFGALGDRFGRRGPLMADIILYSVLEFATGFAPTLTAFLVLRALFGIGMGGEWGLGSSLALETLPAKVRGMFSGLLQEGYATGYLLASIVYGLAYSHVGWRGMFMIGALPALLTVFIRSAVKESPVWMASVKRKAQPPIGKVIAENAGLFAYVVVLMTAFNFMSHGTQDLYPTFLQTQHKFPPEVVSRIAIVYNIGAILGGWFFGSMSQRIGRRRAIIIAALLAIPIVPLWAFSHTAVMLAVGAFMIQFMVQGAWGVVPAHLTELAPNILRGTFIGVAYQTGNLIASVNGPLEQHLADMWHGNYARALATVVLVVFVCLAIVTALGKEKRGVEFMDEPEA